jgi:hypothetical protein
MVVWSWYVPPLTSPPPESRVLQSSEKAPPDWANDGAARAWTASTASQPTDNPNRAKSAELLKAKANPIIKARESRVFCTTTSNLA